MTFMGGRFFRVFHSQQAVLVLLKVPIIRVVLFNFTVAARIGGMQINMLSPSGSVIAHGVVSHLSTDRCFSIGYLLRSPRRVRETFRRGRVSVTLIFDRRFTSHLCANSTHIRIISSTASPGVTAARTNCTAKIVTTIQRRVLPPKVSIPSIMPGIGLLCGPRVGDTCGFMPNIVKLVLVLVYTVVASVSVIQRGRANAVRVLLMSPIGPLFVVLTGTIPCFMLSFIGLAAVLLLSICMLSIPITNDLF